MTTIVLSGGNLGGKAVEMESPKPGDQIRLDDPARPGRRKLVYEVRIEHDEESDERRIFAVFVGTEQ